jgi:hypothetical protein
MGDDYKDVKLTHSRYTPGPTLVVGGDTTLIMSTKHMLHIEYDVEA